MSARTITAGIVISGLTLSKSRLRSSSSSTLRMIFLPFSAMAPPDLTSLSRYPQYSQLVDMIIMSCGRKNGRLVGRSLAARSRD